MTWDFKDLQMFVDVELEGRPVRLLEAGCGSASNLHFGKNARVTGIDISKKQLERNSILDEKIVGDIQSYEFPPESFDAIICWDVLEHLPQPELALRQFSRAVTPGGIVILKLPNVLSVKGLVTKFFPHWLHVLAYRYFYGEKNAGKEDTAPFKTFLRFSISANAIQQSCKLDGLETIFCSSLDVASVHWIQKKKPVLYPYLMLKGIFQFLSGGIIGDSELVLVLKKPGTEADSLNISARTARIKIQEPERMAA
jgi:ubiquinone/menaquinone biosynthesis C-methylase UbiE